MSDDVAAAAVAVAVAPPAVVAVAPPAAAAVAPPAAAAVVPPAAVGLIIDSNLDNDRAEQQRPVDNEWVDPKNGVHDYSNATCNICFGFYRNPVTICTGEYMHTFCKVCAEGVLASHDPRCPLCRTPCGPLRQIPTFKQTVEQFIVNCGGTGDLTDGELSLLNEEKRSSITEKEDSDAGASKGGGSKKRNGANGSSSNGGYVKRGKMASKGGSAQGGSAKGDSAKGDCNGDSEADSVIDLVKTSFRCVWTGPLVELPKHREKCIFTRIACPNHGCIVQSTRAAFEKHSKRCGFRAVRCPECKVVTHHKMIQKHENKCAKRMMECKMPGCGCTYPQEEDAEHLKSCEFAPHAECIMPDCTVITKGRTAFAKHFFRKHVGGTANRALKDSDFWMIDLIRDSHTRNRALLATQKSESVVQNTHGEQVFNFFVVSWDVLESKSLTQEFTYFDDDVEATCFLRKSDHLEHSHCFGVIIKSLSRYKVVAEFTILTDDNVTIDIDAKMEYVYTPSDDRAHLHHFTPNEEEIEESVNPTQPLSGSGVDYLMLPPPQLDTA
jgi:hypothetical protein